MHVVCHSCQFSLQWIQSYAIGSFLSQYKQSHLLYERIERSMGIHVVNCSTYKMLVCWCTLLPFYWVYNRIFKNLLSCTTMQRSYKMFQQYWTKKTDTNNLKLAIVFVNFCIGLNLCNYTMHSYQRGSDDGKLLCVQIYNGKQKYNTTIIVNI